MKRVRILVAEDHELMRDTVVRLLKQHFDVIDAVTNGTELLEAADRLNPDVYVMDISMPQLNGIEAAMQLKRSQPSAKVIFLTIHNDPDSVGAAFKSGAEGYVLKTRMAADLVIAVREVLAGRKFLSQI